MKQKYRFFWKKEGLDIHNLPVKIKRSSSSKRVSSGHLLCPTCFNQSQEIHQMKQLYKCDFCSTETTIGNIDSRFMDIDTEKIVYTLHEYNEFVKVAETDTFMVIGELDTRILPYVLNMFSEDYELFSNEDKAVPIIQKIHQYLLMKNKSLLVKMSNKTAIVVPTFDRISVFTIRDIRTVKSPQQLGLKNLRPTDKNISEQIDLVLKESIDNEIDLMEQFKGHKLSGEPITEIRQVEQTDSSFATELAALEILA